jgi:hypothetical protein
MTLDMKKGPGKMYRTEAAVRLSELKTMGSLEAASETFVLKA